eukprot:GHVS01060433.1.p1 GENE.GHVS01060433.1~~GHVS01060433.1.p1  ORF type:complete len:201 (+),score=33.90 GHVS01060433.1:222-824(+)
MGGGGGGGGALEKLFPGYKDKIWMRVPPQWRQSLIQRWNSSYESSVWSSYCTSRRLASYHKAVVAPLEPNYSNARIPRIDYKRQTARGTYMEGPTDWYLQSTTEQQRLVNLKAFFFLPPPLEPDLLEYEDGTAATVPQMSKDVTEFLTWAAEPVHDRRKQLGLMGFWSAMALGVFSKLYYRMYWAMYATRRVDFGKIKYM